MNPINYLRETKTELKHVSWPTRSQAINFTILVIAASIFVAALLALFDYGFKIILEDLVLSGVDSSGATPFDANIHGGDVQVDTSTVPLEDELGVETAPIEFNVGGTSN
jgi:preprotein translocase subunit SecE